MNTYGWILLGETMLAMLVLGACGGWVLWPFRRAERPYLWLAAPLAGLFTLGAALGLLFLGAGLPFRWCLGLGLGLNVLGTGAVLVRARPWLGGRNLAVGGAVVLAVAYWATVSCNKASIDAREPTLVTVDGSDMFGYAIVGDWLRAHRAADGPPPNDVVNGLTYSNLRRECSRPITFLLLAAGSEARGTTALFSYDWVGGVILAAGLAGFAAAFASNGLTLVLLAAGAAASSWLTDNRTGYLGKAVAYPGGLLLAGLFLTALAAPTRWRWGATCVIGASLAWCLSPMFPPVLFAIVLGGYAFALAALFVRTRWDEQREGLWAAVARPMLVALALAVSASAPTYVYYREVFGSFPPPPPPTDWSWVIPVSLDLEMPTLKTITPATQERLLRACVAALAVGLAAAVWRRQRCAAALLGCSLFVPFAWAVGEFRLYTFHGLIYPLALAGTAALAEPRPRARTAAAAPEPPLPFWPIVVRGALVAALVVVTVGLRVPQLRASAGRYVYATPGHKIVHRQSESNALRSLLGTEPIDVALGHFADNHMAWAELAARNVPVRFRSPGWEVSVGAYAGPNPKYDLFAPKARFTLLERAAWAAPGTERWAGRRLKLVEDGGAVAVVGFTRAQGTTWDGEWRPGVWIGNAPVTLLLHNGTERPQEVILRANTAAGPARPDQIRTLLYRLGEQTGKLPAPHAGQVTIPLTLAPGANRIDLSVAETAVPPVAPGLPVPLLEFRNWRVEPPEHQ